MPAACLAQQAQVDEDETCGAVGVLQEWCGARTMALRAMPFVIVNLGGEMIYILEQRLRAQSIPPEKAVKVLHDVVKTMFSTKFIAEVPSPLPDPFSEQSLRALDLGDSLWGLRGRR